MSRSIGDLDLKQFGVTADPEISRLRIKHGKDNFLLLATDGISFVMSDAEIVECVKANANTASVAGENAAAREAAEKLVDQALLYSTEDNVTAIVLPLGAWKTGEASKTNVFYSLGRNMALTSRFS